MALLNDNDYHFHYKGSLLWCQALMAIQRRSRRNNFRPKLDRMTKNLKIPIRTASCSRYRTRFVPKLCPKGVRNIETYFRISIIICALRSSAVSYSRVKSEVRVLYRQPFNLFNIFKLPDYPPQPKDACDLSCGQVLRSLDNISTSYLTYHDIDYKILGQAGIGITNSRTAHPRNCLHFHILKVSL